MSRAEAAGGTDASDGHSESWRRDFRYFWAGESVSLVGSQVLQLALPLTAVLSMHATPVQLGWLGAVTSAPYLVVGIPAGALVDRWPRRRVLVASNLVQSAAIGAIPLLAALGRLSFGLLLVAAGVAGLGRVFFTVAYRSYLPTVVPRAHVTGANARLTVSESVAEIAGPGLGGLLVQVVGAPYALLVDAVSYLASAAGYGAVRARESAPPRAGRRAEGGRVSDGFRLVLRNAFLRAFLGEAAAYNLCWQLVGTVLVIFAVRELGLSPGTYGLLLSLGAVGALLGAALTGRVATRYGLGRTLIAAAVIGDLAPLLLPAVRQGGWAVPLVAVAFLIQGVGITACNVHTMSLRQTLVPSPLLGRANAAYLVVAQGVRPVGALLGGWLGTALGVRATLLVGTVGLLSTCLFLVASPVRRVRDLTDVPAAA